MNFSKLIVKNQEYLIFDILLKVVELKTPETKLYAVGGWVRDSLLGIESNDIDIAISNMSGLNFANLVVEYLKENDLLTKTPIVIKANPDQSKHLETAMLEINGLCIDFVNFRKETYTDSRIPVIELGTIEEDASRRDLTINALFYNLHTESIEDYVGGLQDLYDSIAKTPIDPKQTFIDDPLRIYRCIRFATKYKLSVDLNIIKTIKNINVIEALGNKISPERIFKEVGGYLLPSGEWKSGFFSIDYPSSADALELLNNMDLLYILFEDCHIDFYEAYYYLINLEYSEIKSQDILVCTLAILLEKNPNSQISQSLLKIKCPKNIIERVNKLIDSVKFLKMNYDSTKGLRKFLAKAKEDFNLAIEILKVKFMNDLDFIEVIKKIQSIYIEQKGYKIIPPITGKDLLELGYAQSPLIGSALAHLEEKLFENPKMNKEEAINCCMEILEC